MGRWRWLRAEWTLSMDLLNKRMQQHAYSATNGSGFLVDRVRNDCLEGRFFEKREIELSVMDPFGVEILQSQTQFEQWSFICDVRSSGIALIDGSRSTSTIVNAFAAISDFSLSISALSVDVMLWCERFSSLIGNSTYVDQIQIGDIRVNDQISMKSIVKGRSDVKQYVLSSMRHCEHKIERIRLTTRDKSMSPLTLMDTCAAVGGSEMSTHVHDILKASLLECI